MALKKDLLKARGIKDLISVYGSGVVEKEELVTRDRLEALNCVAEIVGADLKVSNGIIDIKR